jgi:hypothetical protein
MVAQLIAPLGLMYAEDNGWLEVAPTHDMQPRDTLRLTADGFAQI